VEDLKSMMQDNYLKYASYVILERAIPDVLDGLKPVQRRILHALKLMHDGKLHKVANVVGQTMPFHPHGDAPIYEALVNLANKEILLERQGNFGNPYTGDPAAAARYIETRLLPLATETLFNSRLTSWGPSYDGRSQEPLRLPVKIPLLLLMGAEGIAVGMSTRIFSHNFQELLQAQIAYLKGEAFTLFPDFSCGGAIDVSEYRDGYGRLRMRAQIDIEDDKTLRIRQICYSTTTESVIQSIEEAAKKGKIRVDSIHDYTAEQPDIEISLPRGQHGEQVREALYALTLCEVSLSAQPVIIHEERPREASVSQMLMWNTDYLVDLLQAELELEKKDLLDSIHMKSLERIFIENKLYRQLEKVAEEKNLRLQVIKDLEPFTADLMRPVSEEDADKLLALPMRRISKFDLEANIEAIASMNKQIKVIDKKLQSMKTTTIEYLETLIKKYASNYPRRTRVESFQALNAKEFDLRKFKVGVDLKTGFVGTKVSSDLMLDARIQDKLLVMYEDASFQVLPIEEKSYLKQENRKPLHVQIYNKDSVFTLLYESSKHEGLYAKRFVIDKFIAQKLYESLGEGEKMKALSVEAKVKVKIKVAATPRKAAETLEMALDTLELKNYKVRGLRLTDRKVTNVQLVQAQS
jgi:topoisomerase-4 subunit A